MSGREVIGAFRSLGFDVLSQKGSHVKLARIGLDGEKQILTVPDHRELDTGTLRTIIRQATKFVPLDDLHPHFYR